MCIYKRVLIHIIHWAADIDRSTKGHMQSRDDKLHNIGM